MLTFINALKRPTHPDLPGRHFNIIATIKVLITGISRYGVGKWVTDIQR